jgi:sec-independent protein translocase protein TatA
MGATTTWEAPMGLENPLHILILLAVVLLVFGAKRLPEMGHSLGSGLRGFKDALSGDGQHHALAAPAIEVPPVAPVAPLSDSAVSRS